jgi:hypothetical protein
MLPALLAVIGLALLLLILAGLGWIVLGKSF